MAPSDPTCSLADLDGWSFPGTALAVLGHPIKHSISPAMHNAALASLAVATPRFSNWRYFRFEVHPDDLPRALDLFHAKNFHGLNLTVPHKVLAVDRVAAIEPIARPIGAINTLRHTPAGWRGHNTDGYGLAAAIRAVWPERPVAVESCHSQIGSGALPIDLLPSAAVTIGGSDLEGLASGLRRLPRPAIGRIARDRLWLDCRCLEAEDEALFMGMLSRAG